MATLTTCRQALLPPHVVGVAVCVLQSRAGLVQTSSIDEVGAAGVCAVMQHVALDGCLQGRCRPMQVAALLARAVLRGGVAVQGSSSSMLPCWCRGVKLLCARACNRSSQAGGAVVRGCKSFVLSVPCIFWLCCVGSMYARERCRPALQLCRTIYVYRAWVLSAVVGIWKVLGWLGWAGSFVPGALWKRGYSV